MKRQVATDRRLSSVGSLWVTTAVPARLALWVSISSTTESGKSRRVRACGPDARESSMMRRQLDCSKLTVAKQEGRSSPRIVVLALFIAGAGGAFETGDRLPGGHAGCDRRGDRQCRRREAGANTGTFTISRTGDTTNPLTINYSADRHGQQRDRLHAPVHRGGDTGRPGTQ